MGKVKELQIDIQYIMNVLSAHGEEKAIQAFENVRNALTPMSEPLSTDELLEMCTENFDEDDSNPIDKIDWTELRNQKTTLLNVIDGLEKLGVNTDNLQGLLATIDSLQDYAVDVMGIDGNNVFDFELEDCEASTPEEIFCKNCARLIFNILCESDAFHQDALMPTVFIARIMAQPKHGDIIKSMIAEQMLSDLKVSPEAFQYTGANQDIPVYDNAMVEDYGEMVLKYCLEKFKFLNECTGR